MHLKRVFCILIMMISIGFLYSDILKIGSEPDYPPYCLVNDAGEAEGFSIDLFEATARAKGLEYEIKIDLWQNIKTDLATGKLDALPLVGKNPEREPLFDFTFPYMSVHGAVFTLKNDNSIKTREDLKDKTIVVMKGDNAEEYLYRVNLTSKIKVTDTFEEAFKLLSKGRYDAVITQRIMGLNLLRDLKIKNIKALDLPLDDFKQEFCFAVMEGNKELLEKLNEGLAIIISNGTYDKIHQKWFSPTAYYSLTFWEKLKPVLYILIPVIMLILIVMYFIHKAEIKRKTIELTHEMKQHLSAKQKQLESETKFKNYVDKAPAGIFVADKNGKYIDVNDAACRITGYSREELIGMNLMDLIEDSYKDEAAQSFSTVKNKGKMSHEIAFVHKSGEIRFWRVDASTLTEDTYLGFTIDTTEKHKAKVELLDNKDKLQYLFDNMNSGFAYHKIIVDKSGKPIDYKYLEINRAFEKMLNLEKKSVIGKTVLEILPGTGDDPAHWIDQYGKVALEGTPIKFEAYSQDVKKWFSISAYSPMKGYFATIFDDITSRKKIEEELNIYQENLENIVQDRTRELSESNKKLERFNKLFIGREFRIKELRDKIEGLEEKLKKYTAK